MDRFTLMIGMGTLLLFGAGGMALVEWMQNRSFWPLVTQGWSMPMQLISGLLAGLASAGLALFVITRPFFRVEKKYYYDLIASKIKLNLGVILFFIALCGYW
ncbi:MAG: hypothetical protein U5L96_06540 [Owenweeksia sp.]|nr:hypothetical protein [Owenweeksia sp.]